MLSDTKLWHSNNRNQRKSKYHGSTCTLTCKFACRKRVQFPHVSVTKNILWQFVRLLVCVFILVAGVTILASWHLGMQGRTQGGRLPGCSPPKHPKI
jgi:hypothetical protein